MTRNRSARTSGLASTAASISVITASLATEFPLR
ncbi:Uncharacterised protein [Mycobacteroides abscessus subsp. abscessus]|nr:Uncharacterised protein [Mycobacteroides abscessus subsp. abscessus]